MANKFDELFCLNVNSKTEKKGKGNNALTYLSWAFAWSEFVKAYPEATYKIIKNGNGLPYFADDSGAMCYTQVTAGGLTHEMWLPVMNGANKAMKKEAYTYSVKDYKSGNQIDKPVEPFTMFDVNKTVMRCLVKNLAMFGLGLYIYAGEDLPEPPQPTKEELEITELHKQINGILVDRNKAGVNRIEIANSVKKHLEVERVPECKDIEKLKAFKDHQANKMKELNKRTLTNEERNQLPQEQN